LANTDARKPALLLVHGAWHGAWCWKDLEAECAESDWATTSIELPSAMRTTSLPEPLPGMHADAQAIRTALVHIDGPVAMSELVSHSPQIVRRDRDEDGFARGAIHLRRLHRRPIAPAQSAGALRPPCGNRRETGGRPLSVPLDTPRSGAPSCMLDRRRTGQT
jgi:hypothetical protein